MTVVDPTSVGLHLQPDGDDIVRLHRHQAFLARGAAGLTVIFMPVDGL